MTKAWDSVANYFDAKSMICNDFTHCAAQPANRVVILNGKQGFVIFCQG